MNSVVFFGTPNFGVPVLQGLVDEGYEVKAVVTQPDKRVGRKQVVTQSPVKQLAAKLNLPVLQPQHLAKSPECAQIIDLHADFLVTAAYGQFLPTKLLQSAQIAAVNVHGSLLPKYRGGAPIQYALLNGDRETGITIMEMVKKMDAGDIYYQLKCPIENDDTAGSLFRKLAILGREALLHELPKIAAGTATKTPQDPQQVVFSPNISKAQEQITLAETAEQAVNKVRALNPDPGAYLLLGNKRLKVWAAAVAPDATSLEAGCLVDNKKRFAISMAGHTVLELREVQPQGKKRMKISDFLNGQGSHFAAGEQIVAD